MVGYAGFDMLVGLLGAKFFGEPDGECLLSPGAVIGVVIG
jgi:hypothetical protein